MTAETRRKKAKEEEMMTKRKSRVIEAEWTN